MDLHLNVDGPHSDDYTRQIAAGFAETMRVLNHATRHPDGITTPATVHAILGSLRDGIARLDQLAQQLDDRLVQFAHTGQLDDATGDPFGHVSTVLRQLTGIHADAAVMEERLNRAHTATSGLHLRDEDPS